MSALILSTLSPRFIFCVPAAQDEPQILQRRAEISAEGTMGVEAGIPAGKPPCCPHRAWQGAEELPGLGGDLCAQLSCTLESYLWILSQHLQALQTQEGGRPATLALLPMTRPQPPPEALPVSTACSPAPGRPGMVGVGCTGE